MPLKFDFTRVGRGWSNEFFKTITRAGRAQLALQRQLKPDADAAEIDAFLDRQDAALVEMERIGDEQAVLLAQVLVDVPEDWLIEGAPDDLDWNAVESLDFIQSDKYGEILEMLRTRDIPRDDAKNSRGHTHSPQKRRAR
jgi:hypothetical protein